MLGCVWASELRGSATFLNGWRQTDVNANKHEHPEEQLYHEGRGEGMSSLQKGPMNDMQRV